MVGAADRDPGYPTACGPPDRAKLAWHQLAADLVDELTTAGELRARRWQHAFRSVPRHVFVPEYLEQDENLAWRRVSTTTASGLRAIYTNQPFYTEVDADGCGVSSTSAPSVMARMIELLDVHPGHRVLEIGTGTGYNTAILCTALGDHGVSTMDIDYTDTARDRLAELSFHPTVRAGDGTAGMSDRAPFDRILSTVAVRHIPWAWIEQLTMTGAILVDLKLSAQAGNLIRVTRNEHGAQGKFDGTGYAAFMSMRHPGEPSAPGSVPTFGPSTTDTTYLPASAWEEPVPWFLAMIPLRTNVAVGHVLGSDYRPTAAILIGDDGSRATIELDVNVDGTRCVTQTGPTRLWDAVERGYQLWRKTGQPGWDRLGVTITEHAQWVWLDEPSSGYRWSLPTDELP